MISEVNVEVSFGLFVVCVSLEAGDTLTEFPSEMNNTKITQLDQFIQNFIKYYYF